ncbi:LITAF-like zinc ribbon domain-containing protein [Ditylenchus destructor]|nr:LITAF-like zinc ribbon domain-containing protein [Ditylenchus destructor]
MGQSQPFQQSWILWKMLPRDDEAVVQIQDPDLKWKARLSEKGKVTTMAHLWSMYNDAYSLENASQVVPKADFYLFKEGIEPEYNMAPNINGGRWRIKLKREHETRFHQMLNELLNELASNSFDPILEEYICGIMATIGYESHTPVVDDRRNITHAKESTVKRDIHRNGSDSTSRLHRKRDHHFLSSSTKNYRQLRSDPLNYRALTQHLDLKMPAVVMVGAPVGPDPVPLKCPSCNAQVVSSVNRRAGGFAWVMCILLSPCFCWIPWCCSGCLDAHHNCPNCGAYLRKHRACCD